MATTSFFPSADGAGIKTDASYSTAHNSASTNTNSFYTISGQGYAMSRLLTSVYGIYRYFATIDTSSLPDDAAISAASYNVYGLSKAGSENPTYNVYNSTHGTLPANSQTMTDWGNAGTTAWCDTPISQSGFSTIGYNAFAFNATGIAGISKTSTTKLCFRNKTKDADNSAPTVNENIYVQIGLISETGTSQDPYLEVTYTETPTLVAFDAGTDGGYAASATSLTFAHTCSGDNRVLCVVTVDDTTGGSKVTSVKYGSSYLLKIDTSRIATSGRYQSTWVLAQPPTGANNVVIARTGAGYVRGLCASWKNCKLNNVPDAVTGGEQASATSIALANTSVQDNCWTIMAVTNSVGTPTAGSGTTRRIYSADGGAGLTILDSNSAKTPAGSVTLTAEYGSSANWAGTIFSLSPVETTGVQIENATEGGYSAGVTTKTFAHTCSGANRGLFVLSTNTSSRSFVGATYNGVAMTQIGSTVAVYTTTWKMALFYLPNPDEGTHDVVVTINASGNIYTKAVSVINSAQTQPEVAALTQGLSPDATGAITTLTDGALVLAGCSNVDSYFFPDAGTRALSDVNPALSLLVKPDNISPAGATTIDATVVGGARDFAIYAISIAPASTPVSNPRVLASNRVLIP